MPLTLAPTRPLSALAGRAHVASGAGQPDRVRQRVRQRPADGAVLAGYIAQDGRARQVVRRGGAGGSVLLIDRDVRTLGDVRLIAHISREEPRRNVAIVCAQYMRDVRGRWCRPVSPSDLEAVPLPEIDGAAEPVHRPALAAESMPDLRGCCPRLRPIAGGMSIPELRWCSVQGAGDAPQPLSVRDVIGLLQSYEPAREATAAAVVAHRHDPEISVATLSVELERVCASRIVLNRGLREAVLAAVAGGRLSMSEIALRCGRVKRSRQGVLSGETTWLARRIGLAGDGVGGPTPWVHSEVLGLIARCGLGISPREVELG